MAEDGAHPAMAALREALVSVIVRPREDSPMGVEVTTRALHVRSGACPRDFRPVSYTLQWPSKSFPGKNI